MLASNPQAEVFYCYIYHDPSRGHEPFYVGKGSGYRAFTHTYRKDNHPFSNRLKKMKREGTCPLIGIYAGLDEELAFFVEEELVSKYGRKDLGKGTLLNLTDGGGEGNGHVHTEEHKLKVSLALKGKSKPLSEEAKARVRALRLGKPQKPESVLKMANSKRGKKFADTSNMVAAAKIRNKDYSEERNRKVSESNKGRVISEETRAKTRANHLLKGVSVGANNPMFGKKQSDETREKIRQKQLAYQAKKREALA